MFSVNGVINQDKFTQVINNLGAFIENDLVIDSRKLTPNCIFCAYKGGSHDGRDYISQAIKMGAGFVLWDDANEYEFKFEQIPNMACPNLSQYVGLIAAHKYGYPSKKFEHVIGVTGTNGKTSITHWLSQAFLAFKVNPCLIGTTGVGIYPNINDSNMTTPDPLSLEALVNQFVSQNAKVLSMEVSSHSLDQGRVNGVAFDIAIFTNLSQDHLDYHHNMENYYNAKAKLFSWQGLKYAIINTDDAYGKRLYQECLNTKTLNLISYGFQKADIVAKNLQITLSGTKFDLCYKDEVYKIVTHTLGAFNVYNLLAVAAALLACQYSIKEVANILGEVKPVVGRMQTVISKDQPLVVIDYAHTPDALENALQNLNLVHGKAKVYCVFGCGGNRDANKRPLMGEIALKNSDYVIVTSDNPRDEDPQEIIEQILATSHDKSNYEVLVNRLDAIKQAFKYAKADDIILIAGKGHETYQEIKGVKEHFSDHESVLKIINSGGRL